LERCLVETALLFGDGVPSHYQLLEHSDNIAVLPLE
jgi:hypothetical protein